MKREEEIKRYCADQGFPYGACSSISSLKAEIATDAIRWADKTMIDKACEWLERNLAMVSVCDKLENHEFIYTDFKKAMEE